MCRLQVAHVATGTAFLRSASERSSRRRLGNWFAAEDRFGNYYEPQLQLATDASRLDLSPAWFSWVGTDPALAVLREIGVEAVHDHDLALANGSGPVSASGGELGDRLGRYPGAEERLLEAGIRAAVRGGSLRASFHVYNTEDDVDAALSALLD